MQFLKQLLDKLISRRCYHRRFELCGDFFMDRSQYSKTTLKEKNTPKELATILKNYRLRDIWRNINIEARDYTY